MCWSNMLLDSYAISEIALLRILKANSLSGTKFIDLGREGEVTDGRLIRADVSKTWNVLSWSGGQEFKLLLNQTWGV